MLAAPFRAMQTLATDRRSVDRLLSEVDRASPGAARALRQLQRLATVDHLRGMADLLSADRASVAIAGPVNVGKSTLANALAGRRVAEVAATPGTTTRPTRHEALGFTLVDTPGADEVSGEARRLLALEAVARADLVLLVLDATRGVTLSSREVFGAVAGRMAGLEPPALEAARTLVESGRLVPCLNKTDLVPRRERAEVRRRAARDLGLAPDAFVEIAAREGGGLDALVRRMVAGAPAMAEALAEAMPAYVDEVAAGLIHRASVVAAAVALTPLPGPDVLPLTAIQAMLVARLARVYGRRTGWRTVGEVAPAVAAGLGFRELFRALAKLVPGPGWALSAGLAFAGTNATGRGAQHLLRSGALPSVVQLARWRREARRGRLRAD